MAQTLFIMQAQQQKFQNSLLPKEWFHFLECTPVELEAGLVDLAKHFHIRVQQLDLDQPLDPQEQKEGFLKALYPEYIIDEPNYELEDILAADEDEDNVLDLKKLVNLIHQEQERENT